MLLLSLFVFALTNTQICLWYTSLYHLCNLTSNYNIHKIFSTIDHKNILLSKEVQFSIFSESRKNQTETYKKNIFISYTKHNYHSSTNNHKIATQQYNLTNSNNKAPSFFQNTIGVINLDHVCKIFYTFAIFHIFGFHKFTIF